MKISTIFAVSLVVFAVTSVYAYDDGGSHRTIVVSRTLGDVGIDTMCNGGCSKPKPAPKPAPDVMCGGGGCDKPKPAPEPDMMCGGGGCDKPKPAPEPDMMCGGGGCGKPKPAPEPDVMCGGGKDKDKDKSGTNL